uniref:Immunoglobulin V-set domain-containing protein n=1 Tax=Chelonoidis abingdonii TaxID=106734 RepID=A0A8C0GNA1_CHEAB
MHCIVLHCMMLYCVGLAYVEQLPFLTGVPGESQTLQSSESMTCTLKDTTYPWMSWYLQDAQGQMHFLESLRNKGDTGNTSRMGTSYQTERVTDTVLRLEMKNVTQSQIIYCTCSKEHRLLYMGKLTRTAILQ